MEKKGFKRTQETRASGGSRYNPVTKQDKTRSYSHVEIIEGIYITYDEYQEKVEETSGHGRIFHQNFDGEVGVLVIQTSP